MMDQAKQKKLQKGYVLEPVIPTYTDDASLPDKRERKKSSHFGKCGGGRPGDVQVTLWLNFNRLQSSLRSSGRSTANRESRFAFGKCGSAPTEDEAAPTGPQFERGGEECQPCAKWLRRPQPMARQAQGAAGAAFYTSYDWLNAMEFFLGL